MENLLEYYRKSDSAVNKKIAGCNSAKKVAFFKKKVATLALFQPASAKASAGAVPGADKSCNRLEDFLRLVRLQRIIFSFF
jgi:hypothetical protein